MADRLQALRAQMSREKDKRDSEPGKVGGAKWRSARTDRGSVRNYAKEVKERNNQKVAAARNGARAAAKTSGGVASSSARQTQPGESAGSHGPYSGAAGNPQQARSSPNSSNSSNSAGAGKQVEAWGVADTVEWVTSLGLGQYAAVFEANEISGPVLVEVGLEDLDYMEVKVLAHRKGAAGRRSEVGGESAAPHALCAFRPCPPSTFPPLPPLKSQFC